MIKLEQKYLKEDGFNFELQVNGVLYFKNEKDKTVVKSN